MSLKGSTKEDCGSTEDDTLLSSERGQSLLQSQCSKRSFHREEATARLRGLETPRGESIGTRMMRMMGWKEGEPLGARDLKDGIQEPLRPDLTRLYKRQRCLGYTTKLLEQRPELFPTCTHNKGLSHVVKKWTYRSPEWFLTQSGRQSKYTTRHEPHVVS